LLNVATIERIATIVADPECTDAATTLINTGIPYEASVAIETLRYAGQADRAIVDAINLRMFLGELGVPPLRLGYDFDTLVRDGSLVAMAPGQYAARLSLPSHGEVLVEVAGEVKICEWIRFIDGFDVFELNHRGEEFLVHPHLVSLIMRHPNLLRELQLLYHSFGLVFNPREYMSVESFLLEHASDTMESLSEMFA
jgi:hypothetical protein